MSQQIEPFVLTFNPCLREKHTHAHLPSHEHFKVHLGKEGVILAQFEGVWKRMAQPEVYWKYTWRYNSGKTQYDQGEFNSDYIK